MTKVFFTGGTGFIGRHLLNVFSDYGLEIKAIRRTINNFPDPCIGSIQWLNSDLETITIKDLLDVDILIHLASVGVSPKLASKKDMHYHNVILLNKLLQKAHIAGVKKVMIAGSFMEYGLSANKYHRIPPEADLMPNTPDGYSKAESFQMAYDFCSKNNMHIKYARISNVFGNDILSLNIFSSLKKAAMAGEDFDMTFGEQIRDFISLKTVCNYLLDEIVNFNDEFQQSSIFNICSGEGVSIADFCTQWWNIWDANGKLNYGKIEYRPNEIWRIVGLPHNLK